MTRGWEESAQHDAAAEHQEERHESSSGDRGFLAEGLAHGLERFFEQKRYQNVGCLRRLGVGRRRFEDAVTAAGATFSERRTAPNRGSSDRLYPGS